MLARFDVLLRNKLPGRQADICIGKAGSSGHRTSSQSHGPGGVGKGDTELCGRAALTKRAPKAASLRIRRIWCRGSQAGQGKVEGRQGAVPRRAPEL